MGKHRDLFYWLHHSLAPVEGPATFGADRWAERDIGYGCVFYHRTSNRGFITCSRG